MIGAYERAAERLLAGQPNPRPLGRLFGGKWRTGTQSLHMTRQSRAWHLFWRIKRRRIND